MLADLYAYLTSGTSSDPDRQTALTALQAAVGTRVFPDFLKERPTMPALAYTMIDSFHEYELTGGPIDIDYARVQLDVYSNSAVERETVAGYIKAALDGFIGTMGSTEVGLIEYDSERNEYLPESLQYRKSIDFKVVHYT